MKNQNLFGTKSTWVVAAILLVFLLLTNCQQKTTVKEADEEQKAKEELMIELTQSCFDIWMSGNLSLVDEVYSPELIRHVAGFDDVVGIEAYKKEIMTLHTAFPDMVLSFEIKFIKDDEIMYITTFTGTQTGSFGELPPTGKKVTFSGVEIDRIVDGKIVEEWAYTNYLDIYTQLGFTLTPPEILDK